MRKDNLKIEKAIKYNINLKKKEKNENLYKKVKYMH